MATWKVWNFVKTTVHHFVLSGKTNFLTILFQLRAIHGTLPQVVEITIKFKQQLRNNTILSRALFRNAQ
jgi:hypothetical protein